MRIMIEMGVTDVLDRCLALAQEKGDVETERQIGYANDLAQLDRQFANDLDMVLDITSSTAYPTLEKVFRVFQVPPPMLQKLLEQRGIAVRKK